jgi:hypothetical protein
MKRISIVLFMLISIASANAQVINDSVRYMESVWSMKKKEIVVKQMQLTEAEKAAFWPVYDSYSNAIQFIELDYVQIMGTYATQVDLTEKKLAALSQRMLKNDLLLARVRKQYFRKFSRAVSPLLAEQFMQLDNSMRTIIRAEMQQPSAAATTASPVAVRNKN